MTAKACKSDPELVRIEHRHDGNLVGIFFVKKAGDHFRLLDEKRRVIAETRDDNGAATLLDERGRVLVRLDDVDVRTFSTRAKETGSPKLALGEALGDRTVLVAGRVSPTTL